MFTNSGFQKLNDEILAELAKPEPDYEKLKTLRAEMEILKSRETGATDTAPTATETDTNSVMTTAITAVDLVSAPTTVPTDSTASYTPPTPTISSTPADLTPEKPSSISGLTIALYVGSLLILAGTGGLVASGAKIYGLIALILMTIIFYGGGLALRNNQTLKSASYVFVGTGMLMLPFLGLLIYDLTRVDAQIIWCIMSLVGVPMYLVATYIMNNKVFSYFAIAGFVSLSCSLASVMSLAVVWYFVFIMALGIIAKVINLTSLNNKLGVMAQSIDYTGDWLPLATFIASLMAFTALSELDYVIILGITLLHLIASYVFDKNIARETLLRLLLPAWFTLLLHFIIPERSTIGLMLECAALCQTILVFFNVSKGLAREQYRRETEIGWLIASLICFVVAAPYVATAGSATSVWAWVSFALAIDTVIIFIAAPAFKEIIWYFGPLVPGVFLPLTLTAALSLNIINATPAYVAIYLLEMVGFTALSWKDRYAKTSALLSSKNTALFATSTAVFGLAAIIAGINHNIVFISFLVAALCLWFWGAQHKNITLKELAVYSAALGIFFIVDCLNANLHLGIKYDINFIILAHLALIACIISSLLWDWPKSPRVRLLIGCIALLLIVGNVAISGTTWAMYLFITEAVAVLLAGVLMKNSGLRITGAVGAFLSVLWFTRDLSFAWPIILGLGLIGTVVFILVRNSHKTPVKQ